MYVYLFESLFSILLDLKLGVESLGHMVILFNSSTNYPSLLGELILLNYYLNVRTC